MDAKGSDLSLRLKPAKLSADRVFTESGFHMVGAVTVLRPMARMYVYCISRSTSTYHILSS